MPHPALLSSEYLEACVLELAARGTRDDHGRASEKAEEAWLRATGKRPLFTECTDSSTSDPRRTDAP
jgi:hypothetical protein